ncbi:MAG: FAD/NAD(P)-binding oxidoreductase [Sulfuriferula sp.]
MNTLSRRDFMKFVGAAVSLAALPLSALAELKGKRVVVIGGGFGGGTAAKFLRLWAPDLEVILIEPNPTHVACIMSNLYYANKITLQQLTLSYAGLVNRGVTVVQDRVTVVNVAAHKVRLASGREIVYDKLVMAPGIDFAYPDGLKTADAQAKIPHAWKDTGSQAPLLRNQLQAMPDGGSFVMTIPLAPYRCPPGPYERACMVAAYFKRSKPRSKVIVLDANPKILVEETTFANAFTQTYAGMIDYRPNTMVISVDANNRSVATVGGTIKASVLNVIPEQQAGKIAFDAGLVNYNGRWAGVNVQTFQSTVAGAGDVFVIGDAHGSNVGKSGHFANSEAKLAAAAIIAQLEGTTINALPMLANTCYSAITTSSASWASSVMTYQNNAMVNVAASVGDAPPTGDNYEEMFDWSRNLFADSLA